MTIKQLKEELEKYPDNLFVSIANHEYATLAEVITIEETTGTWFEENNRGCSKEQKGIILWDL